MGVGPAAPQVDIRRDEKEVQGMTFRRYLLVPIFNYRCSPARATADDWAMNVFLYYQKRIRAMDQRELGE